MIIIVNKIKDQSIDIPKSNPYNFGENQGKIQNYYAICLPVYYTWIKET